MGDFLSHSAYFGAREFSQLLHPVFNKKFFMAKRSEPEDGRIDYADPSDEPEGNLLVEPKHRKIESTNTISEQQLPTIDTTTIQ